MPNVILASTGRAAFARLPSEPVPVASFAAVVGIVALGLDWRAAGPSGSGAYVLGDALVATGAVVFAALLVLWGRRMVSHSIEIRTEWKSPITASLFGTIVISISLLAAGALPRFVPLASVLWSIAAAGGIGLLITLLARWIEGGIDGFALTPALFIPIIGNATTAFAGVPLGVGEIAWLSYAVALFTWLAIGPLVMYRLLVVEPRLPRKMAPQLGVLVSSPAVLASAWYVLSGGADEVFKLLAFDALFFALLALRLWRIGWGEPFNVAMWGWVFPAAALAGAFERAARALSDPLYGALGSVILAVATLAFALCGIGTIRGWLRRMVAPVDA